MMNLLSIGYTVVALIMEFNSVFLHARKLLKFYQFDPKSLIVRLNSFLNVFTFVLFRFGVLGIIYYGIIFDGHRVTINYLIMLCSCVFAMTIINIVLFKRILIKDCLSSKPKSNSSINNNDIIILKNQNEQIERASLIEINNMDNLHDNENKSSNGYIKSNVLNHQYHPQAVAADDPNNNMVIKKTN